MSRSVAPRLRRWGALAAGACGAWLAAAALPGASPAGATGGEPAPRRLVPGAAVVQALAAGEVQVFAADLAPGEPYLVAAEQRGIELVLAVIGPDGASLAAVDGPLERWGTELLLLRPAATGAYRIEVRSEKRGVGAGAYELRLDRLAEATPAERERAAALAAATAAGAILYRRAPGSLDGAVAAYEEARGHFHAAADRRGEAEALTALAALARRQGKRREAAEIYRDATARWRELEQPGREIRALNDLGLTLWELGDLAAADTALARGLAMARDLGDRYDQADLRNNQCLVVHARGEIRTALDCYREALALFRQLGEVRDEALVLNNLGFAYYSLGEPQPAEDDYRRALQIHRSTGDRTGEAQTLNNLAVLFRSLGEVGAALAHYAEEREILASLDDRRLEATALNNLGVAYNSLGEAERARLYLAKALELRRAAEDRRGEIVTLNNLGWVARGNGDPGKAIALHRQALELALAASDRRAEGLTLSYLGEARAASGQPAAALDDLDRALALHRQAGDRYHEAQTLRRKAEALTALPGRSPEALPLLDESLALARAGGDRLGEAASLAVRARALRDAGRLEEARRDAEAAIAGVESLRAGLGSPDLRAAFLGSRRDAYELQIDVLMRLDAAHPGQGFDRAALEASERARARSLLDVLRESGSSTRAAVDPALAERQRDLERRLALKTDRYQDLLGRAGTAGGAALALEIEQLTADLDNLEAELRRRSPRYAELTRPEEVSTPQIQALLDDGTLLLEYSLGRERSYLWAVDAASLHTLVLPGRDDVERAARAFHEAVSAPASPGGGDRIRLGGALGRMLLGPVAGELGHRRLAIVADGALHFIPFDVLPEPRTAGDGRARGPAPAPLLQRHEVVELPSAAVLAVERRQLAHRPPAPRLAIVLADPVFQREDPRVARAGVTGAPAGGEGDAGGGNRGRGAAGAGADFSRLRFSRREAEAIAALAPPGAVVAELDFAANRGLALSGRLRDYRYVHFATHGSLDTARPELSGLVLSRVDPAGRPVEGFLRLRDIYALDLAADLVVLSGCQTALGKEIRGEGLLGLTRGFLYAGAPRVVASLWWIDDRATAELMASFYRAMWIGGLRPAAALRQARLALAAERRFRDPFYWGAFVLEGDWR
jgi:CHAT domain-containing protein/tetratricopeptide (TPR) repeat protein